MSPHKKSANAPSGRIANRSMSEDRALAIILPAAKAIGQGRVVIIRDDRRDLAIEALDVLAQNRAPDPVLATAMGVGWNATCRECSEMLRGRLGLRPQPRDAFANEVLS